MKLSYYTFEWWACWGGGGGGADKRGFNGENKMEEILILGIEDV
jgi:hypothetical protein